MAITVAEDNDDTGDGLPTMGEEAEAELKRWVCTCGRPDLPGVVHRLDAPCYHPDNQPKGYPND